jgi:hypothetical protein
MTHMLVRTTALVSAAALLPVGAAAATTTPPAGRGTLVSVTPLKTLTAAQTRKELTGAGFDAKAVRNGVDTYRLRYRTVDVHGGPTTATGLLVLPRTGARTLRTVSFNHGTQNYRGEAPSLGHDDFGPAPVLTYGGAGFAAVTADYLGLGLGPGPHPWMDVPSEVTASVDMLRAARAATRRKGRELDRKVYVTGFSQGGSAAMGLGRALQGGADPWFRLGALAPVSGGYAFRRVEIPALLGGKVEAKAGTVYTAYLLVAYNRLHHLYGSPAEVFKARYAATIEGLFDGNHTGEELFKGTPWTVGALLTPRGRRLLEHPTPRFAAALKIADGTCSWTPRVPVRLFFSRGDEQAVTGNSVRCRADLGAHGVRVRLIDLGTRDYAGSRHLGSNVAGTTAVVRWFRSLS